MSLDNVSLEDPDAFLLPLLSTSGSAIGGAMHLVRELLTAEWSKGPHKA